MFKQKPYPFRRVRLVMLFSLRYEREGRAQTSDLLQRLQETGVPRQQLGLVRTLLLNCGQEKRVGDLFSDMTFSSRFATLAKQNLKVGLPPCSVAHSSSPQTHCCYVG